MQLPQSRRTRQDTLSVADQLLVGEDNVISIPVLANDLEADGSDALFVVNVSQTTVVRDAWTRGDALSVHGWVYDLRDGLLRDLSISTEAPITAI